jgi:hypothetical protein
MKHDLVIANATSWKIAGTYDGKAFVASWKMGTTAIGGFGAWCVEDPGNRFNDRERVTITNACRTYLQMTGRAAPCPN